MFQTNPTVGRLRELTVMGGVSERERRKRARHFDTVQLPAGTEVIRQGERNRHTYFVVSGAVAVTIDGEQVAHLGIDSVVGERTALGYDTHANATVTTTEDTTLLILDHRAVVALAADEPTVRQALEALHRERSAA